MKHLPIKLNPYLLFILLSTSCLLVSCGAYQNTYNNDGIYGDVQEAEGYRKVIVVDEQEYQEYEDNYFLKKLNSLDRINREDVFTEVENYNSVDITLMRIKLLLIKLQTTTQISLGVKMITMTLLSM